MSKHLTLVSFMKQADRARLADGGNFTCSDVYEQQVKSFLTKNRFPYSNCFVCISVFEGEIPPNNLAALYGRAINQSEPGLAALLKADIVLDEIEIVADGDLQDIAKNGNNHLLSDGNIKSYLRKLHKVEGSMTDRMDTLIASARAVPTPKYAEARMFRPLVADDVDRFEEV